MKKVFFLLLVLLIAAQRPCFAIDHSAYDNLLSWLNFDPGATTPDKVTSMLGKPAKVEEGKKRTSWYYENGETNMVISWSNKSDDLEKFSFKSASTEKTTFDARIPSKLKSGVTDIQQAIKILGLPKDMTIRAVTQEMHYAYEHSVLRLFFRNRTLVDFTLLSQK